MDLLLSRHGNTFGPNDPVVWAGSSNDLPLVEKGFAQAEKLASALLKSALKPAAVYCSPLRRTGDYAAIVVDKLKLPAPPVVDPRLNELDYGPWTGLTNEQVAAKAGEAALKAWDENSQWPERAGWGGSEAQTMEELRSFVQDLLNRHKGNELVLAVTSNGRLRYFLKLVDGEFERRTREGTFKVKTGHVCKLSFRRGAVAIPYWNLDPSFAQF